MRTERGFTLVEILVVMAIVAIVGIIMVVIFTNTLRGSNKSQILSVIKQNGQAVLENMNNNIRNADNSICSTSPSNTLVVVKNGTYIRYRISLPGNDKVPPACFKNGCIVWDNPTKQIDLQTNQLETDSAFISSVCGSNDPIPRAGSADTANILTDTNSQTGVAVPSGSFTLSKPPGFKAAVTVAFELQPGVDAPSIIASQIDPVDFQTTIELR